MVCGEWRRGCRIVGWRALPHTNHDQLCLKSEVAWRLVRRAMVCCTQLQLWKQKRVRERHIEKRGRYSISILGLNETCVMAVWWWILAAGFKWNKMPEKLTHSCRFGFLQSNSILIERKLKSTQAYNLAVPFDIWNSIFLVTFTSLGNAQCVGSLWS